MKKKRAYLTADVILKVIADWSNCSEEFERLFNREFILISSHHALYEALACLEKGDDFDASALKALMEIVDFKDPVFQDDNMKFNMMTPQRKRKIRKNAGLDIEVLNGK